MSEAYQKRLQMEREAELEEQAKREQEQRQKQETIDRSKSDDIDKATEKEQKEQEEFKAEKAAKLGTTAGKSGKNKNLYDALADVAKIQRNIGRIETSEAESIATTQAAMNNKLAENINTVRGHTWHQGITHPYYTLEDGTPITNAMVDQWEQDLAAGEANLVEINKAIAAGKTNTQSYNQYIKNLEEQSLKPHVTKSISYKTQEAAKTEKQLNNLKDQGLIVQLPTNAPPWEPKQYKLGKPVQYLSDAEEKLLKAAGFDLPELGESLSWSMLEAAKKEPRTDEKGLFGIRYSPKGAKTAAAFAVSGVETFLGQISGLFNPDDFGGFDIRGKQHANIDTVEEYMPNLTTGQVTAAKAIGYGTTTGLNTVSMATLSYATGSLLGVGGQAVADKLKTPIGKKSLLGKITAQASKNPVAAKALSTVGKIAENIKPHVGIASAIGETALTVGYPVYHETKKAASMAREGKPWENVAGHVLMDVGSMAGFAYGLSRGIEKGKDLYSKGKYYLSKNGKIVKSSDVIPEYIDEDGDFPSFRGDELEPSRENYIKLAQKYAPEELRIGEGVSSWSASSNPFHTVFDVKTGLNKRGEAGMFFSYGGSEYFLRLGDDAMYSASPGLPRFNASPQWVYSEFTDVVETNLGKKAAGGMGDLLDELAGSGKIIMPSSAIQMGEAQAILSGGTRMVEVQGGNFWMQHGDRLVKIGRYLPETTAKELGVDIVAGSEIGYGELSSILSSGGVSVNYSTYLPVSFPMISDDYPEVNELISSLSGMSETELTSWAESASPSELAAVLSVISASKTNPSYTAAYTLVTPTLVSEYSELYDSQVSQASNLIVDYGSSITSELTGETITSTSDISTSGTGDIPSFDVEARRKMNQQLFHGQEQQYKVTYRYPRRKKEAISPITARSLDTALGMAQRRKKVTSEKPDTITVESIP